MALDLTNKFNNLWTNTGSTLKAAASTISHTAAATDQYAMDALMSKYRDNQEQYGDDFHKEVSNIMAMYD